MLSVLQKIVNMTWRQTGNDIVKLSRWLRCLFQLALTYDENISLKCVDQAAQIAAARQGVSCPFLFSSNHSYLPTPADCSSDRDLVNAYQSFAIFFSGQCNQQ